MPPVSPERDLRFVLAALAASDDCIKIIGLDGTLQFMSEGGQRVMEIDDFAVVKGCPWPDFWKDQGHLDAIAAIATAREGRTARFKGTAATGRGNLRYWDVKVSPILGDDGTVECILSVSRDITELKRFEESQELLRSELSHRIGNILGLVQAVASQSLRDDDDMRVAKPAFAARLAALGAAHQLLINTPRERASLEEVTATVAREYEGRMTAEGPAVDLAARSALAIALTLHELTTNAVKYGALSGLSGRVAIRWTIHRAAGAEATLELTWTEQGGPEIAPPTRSGFGSLMIERALAGYVSGAAEVNYPRTGLRFVMRAPMAALIED